MVHKNKGRALSEEHKRKISLANMGKHLTEETKLKLSLVKKGSAPFKGKIHREESRKKISETRKKLIGEGKIKLNEFWKYKKNKEPQKIFLVKPLRGGWNKGIPNPIQRERFLLNNPNKDGRLWKNPDFIQKQKLARQNKPNKKEKELIRIIQENNLPYNFVGDFSFWINGKNPDFVHKTEKKVIELLSRYWHIERNNGRYYYTEEGRKKFFNENGYDCLIIWDYELREISNVIKKINEFTYP